jgi:HSP20 family molecular chaperone IbpA
MVKASLFNAAFDDMFNSFFSDKDLRSYPPGNIWRDENNGAIIFEFAVAGFKKDEIEIETTYKGIKISAKHPEDYKTFRSKLQYLQRHIAERDFSFIVQIPHTYDMVEAISSLEDGMLTIKVPPKHNVEAKKIPIL